MDNEYTRRLDAQGNRAVSKYLAAIFHSLEEIKEQLREIKNKKTVVEPKK